MKYYAVTKGEYSDYHIITITADKEKAEMTAKLHNEEYHTARVEEYEDNIEVLLPLYEITYSNDGIDIARKEEWALTEFISEGKPKREVNKIYECGYWWLFFVRANSEEHARKIAQDLIAEYKAKKAGIV